MQPGGYLSSAVIGALDNDVLRQEIIDSLESGLLAVDQQSPLFDIALPEKGFLLQDRTTLSDDLGMHIRADGAASCSASWISAAVQPPEDAHGISRTGRLLRAGRVAPSATTLATAIVSFSGSGGSPFWAPNAAMLETPLSLSVASTASRSR